MQGVGNNSTVKGKQLSRSSLHSVARAALRFPACFRERVLHGLGGGGGVQEGTRGIRRPQRVPRDDGHFAWGGSSGKVDPEVVQRREMDRIGVAATLEVK